MIEAAKAILRSSHPLATWGKRLPARKGAINLAVAALARKLTVAVWYLLMGRWTPLDEIDAQLSLKVGKMIGQVGSIGLKQLGKTRAAFREDIYQSLKTGRVYLLDPEKKFVAAPSGLTAVAAGA